MPRNITQYDLLISCPGDIEEEIDIINNAVEKFNQQFSEVLNIAIRIRHWSKSSYAQSGDKPQDILNNQFVNKCDAAVAIFWTRFGTPTDRYGSGTEEEIENMLSSHKQIFMYFCDKPVCPSQMNSDGYKKIQEFKERYKQKGLYFVYKSNDEFERLFFAHLTEYFISQKRISTIALEKSKLSIKGIVDSDITPDAQLCSYDPVIEGKTPEDIIIEIRNTFSMINKQHLGKKTKGPSIFSGALAGFHKPVELKEDTIKLVKSVAENLKISLEEDFFELGDLSENTMASASAIMGCDRQSLIGTSEEKRKYKLITSIESQIGTFLGISSFSSSFKGLYALSLCLDNSGSSYDEDIDITLKFPLNTIILPEDFPCKDVQQKEFLLDKCDLEKIFGLEPTVNYIDYADSFTKPLFHSPTQASFSGFYGRDIDEEFQNSIEDIFCYDFYSNGEQIFVKLHFDYIKHHTAVAFPSILLFKIPVNSIEYIISSKHNSEIINSVLIVNH